MNGGKEISSFVISVNSRISPPHVGERAGKVVGWKKKGENPNRVVSGRMWNVFLNENEAENERYQSSERGEKEARI